jgi:hypothetical protein
MVRLVLAGRDEVRNETSQPDVTLHIIDRQGKNWICGAWVGALEDEDGNEETIQSLFGQRRSTGMLPVEMRICRPADEPTELERLRTENAELRAAGQKVLQSVEAAGGKTILLHAVDGKGHEWVLGCQIMSAVANGGQVGEVADVLRRLVDVRSLVVVDP